MKDRFVTLGLALGAFALFYALFVPKPAADAAALALPVSTEKRDDGYQGLWRWLGGQGIRVVSFRDRYDRLAQQDTADTGNLLIVTLPQQVTARLDELRKLDAWLEQGNTLLVMAALDDTPAWAPRSGGDLLGVLARMTRLKFGVIKEEEPDTDSAEGVGQAQALQRAVRSLLQPQRGLILARGSHPLFAGVGSVATASAYPASRWKLNGTEDGSAPLELGVRADRAQGSAEAEPAVWLKRHGEGQIIVLAYASPFSNALMGEQDNARLFANIVAWSLSAHGAVLFDDAHQGLVNYYDAKAFFADPRLHRSLLWLCALWLLFVLGWQRLRPRADEWNPVDVTTFIKVTGSFIAGKVAANLVGQRLCANFFNRIRQRLAMPQDGLPVWDWLAAQAGVPAHDLERLRALYARAHSRKRVDLVQLQNCLSKITGSLL